MIVDTSALVAVLAKEDGHEALLRALTEEDGLLPAPVLVEFHRVVSRSPRLPAETAELLLSDLFARRLDRLAFTGKHGDAAIAANRFYGIGTAAGGTLNLLDLMVYGCAKVEGMPILCTGLDFAATDARIHPASRRG